MKNAGNKMSWICKNKIMTFKVNNFKSFVFKHTKLKK